MRKIGLLFLALLVTSQVVNAQGIEFEHKSFEEACQLAEKEDKLIFIDFYTDWCGPCKQMAASIFPLPEVGEFYNANFINLKLNAETEARDLAKKYNVHSFPTFLFLNSEGELITRTSGSRPANLFIEIGKEAVATRTSKYSYTKLNEMYPNKLDDEKFLQIYIDKMIEYKQTPSEAIDAYLSVQTSIKERDVDMMEYLLKYSNYLMLGGKAEQLYHDNYDEYWDIATRAEEKTLEKMYISMCKNTKTLAYQNRDAAKLKLFIEAAEGLEKEKTKKVNFPQYYMDYALMSEDIPAFKALAIAYVDSIMEDKPLEQIKEEDQAYYEKMKKAYAGRTDATTQGVLEKLKGGRQAHDIVEDVLIVTRQYSTHVEKKKEYKLLTSWINYTEELLPGDNLVENAKANLLYAKGKTDEAIVLKEKVLAKMPDSDKTKGKYKSELELMKAGKSLN